MSTTNTFAVREDILKVIKTNEVINMPHFENCSIILKSKVSHLFFSPSLDNEKIFKQFHCTFLYSKPKTKSRASVCPYSTDLIGSQGSLWTITVMGAIIMTVVHEYVVPSPWSKR